MIHSDHNHPQTRKGNYWCRMLRLADRPTFADNGSGNHGYFVNAYDAQGRFLDLNGTPEGEVFQVWSDADAVWVTRNLTHGVDHDFDADTHTLRKVAKIELRLFSRSSHSRSGWAVNGHVEVHTLHADGTRTYEMVKH